MPEAGNDRRRAHAVASAVGLLVVGVVTAGTVTWLGTLTQREDRAVAQLTEVGRIVNRIEGDLLEAETGNVVPGEIEERLATLEGTIAQLPPTAPIAELEAVVAQFSDQYQPLTTSFESTEQFEQDMMAIVDRAIPEASQRARSAQTRATVGTWAVVLGAVALLGAFAVRLRRQGQDLARAGAVQRADQRLRRLIAASPEFVIVARVDDGSVTYLSPAAEAALADQPQPITVGALRELLHEDDRAMVVERLLAVAASGGAVRFETRVHLHNGERHLECTVSNHQDDLDIRGMVLNAIDVTERAQLALSLSHQATHDSLTGLLNRQAFLAEVDLNLATDRDLGILLLDLDGFKEVNDTLGHSAGDRVLITAAARLATLVRDRDKVARLGGDEFAVMVVDPDTTGAQAAARRIIDIMSAPIDTGESTEVFLTCSVGIAPGIPGLDATTLLKRADAAMYEAKEAGRARYETFAPALEARFAHRIEMRSAIERGLNNREFVLQYQPIHTLDDRRLVGFEALLRWQRPDGTFMNPGEFLPIAEASGQIVQLGRWVTHAALRQLGVWRHIDPELGISINVSPRQLGEEAFVNEVAALLDTHGIVPSAATFEVTETMLINDPDRTAVRLAALKALGVRLAIDDYGAGNAAIAFLLRFPIDVVKFDRKLIEALDTSPVQTEALIRSITTLAHSLQLETVAEGIERADQLGVVAELGCSKAQGYHLARPMFPDRAERYLLAHGVARR